MSRGIWTWGWVCLLRGLSYWSDVGPESSKPEVGSSELGSSLTGWPSLGTHQGPLLVLVRALAPQVMTWVVTALVAAVALGSSLTISRMRKRLTRKKKAMQNNDMVRGDGQSDTSTSSLVILKTDCGVPVVSGVNLM